MATLAVLLQEIHHDLLGFRLSVGRQPHAFDQAVLAVVLAVPVVHRFHDRFWLMHRQYWTFGNHL